MKAGFIGAALVVATAAAVGFYPYLETAATGAATVGAGAATIGAGAATGGQAVGPAARIEVVFVLDTTSSMTGLIAAAKDKIWSIATTLARAEQAPELAMGIVAYRDRGDEFVTQVFDLSSDLDTMYGHLMQFAAVGGGDGPESVNRALDDAVRRISWSQDPSSYRVVFLVGDSPPHMDYQGEAQYPEIVREAVARGIVVNTIQCGTNASTVPHWSEIARLGNGRYLQVGQGGDTFAVTTPFDEDLAGLSAELDGTRLFYGDAEQMHALDGKVAATERFERAASDAMRARRAAYNSTAAGRANLFGEQDLVEDVMSGEVALDAVPEAELPERLRELDAAERARLIESLAEQRQALRSRIDALNASRAAWIDEQVDAADGVEGSLDRQLYDVVREQAAPKGLSFESGPEF